MIVNSLLEYTLKRYGAYIKNVSHIGGHIGEEAMLYSQNKNIERLYYFEPVSFLFNDLVKNTEKFNFIRCFNYALGSENRKNKIFIPANSKDTASSSMLEPRPSDITFEKEEIIDEVRFDSLNLIDCDLVVIDTQGYELEVLKGFGEKIKIVNFFIVEVELIESYIGRALMNEIDEFFKQKKFIRHKTKLIFSHKKWGDSCWGDALYVKESSFNKFSLILKSMQNKYHYTKLYKTLKVLFDIKFHMKLFKLQIKKLLGR